MTAPRPEVLLPVEAHGTLRLDSPDGRALQLLADGDTLRVDLPGRDAARSLMPRSFRRGRMALRALDSTLSRYSLTLSVESSGESLMRLGRNVKPSWLARLLGLAPAHIPFSAVRFFLRRRFN